MHIRENIRNIEQDTNKIKKLRKAFSEIMTRIDNQGYAYVANHHGWLDGLCPHGPEQDPNGNWNHTFLPWHRMYLLKLEKFLQERESDVSLPWWDWRSEQSKREGIPKALSERVIDSQPNPLNTFPMDIRGRARDGRPVNINRNTFRDPQEPDEIRSRQNILRLSNRDIPQLYNVRDFRQFSEDLRRGWHNFIHGWVGGDMNSVDTAAYDPIFYIHHCNIDRIWSIWQTIHGVDSVPSHMLNVVLEPFKVTVKDTLDIHTLEYEYASSVT